MRDLFVAHIITRLIVGGAQENTLATVLGLHRKPGVKVRLLSGPTTGSEGSLEPAAGAVPGLLTLVPDLVRPVRPLSDWNALRQLTRILTEWKPDIVHTHSGKAGVLGRLAARRAKVPLILHTIHGPSFGRFQGRAANRLFRAAERLAARRTHHFISVAQAMTDQYLAAGIGSPDQYTRIFSGFKLDRFLEPSGGREERARLGIAPEELVLAKLARLAPLKGHADLLDIAPELARMCPNIRFLLIGDGPLRSAIQARAAGLGLAQQFVFTGMVAPERVPALLDACDILVHLSLREGLPRALPQALAAAKPVVAYDCDGAGEVCLDDRTGFLVKAGDTSTLIERVCRLANDPALRGRFGGAGRALVREQFSEQGMVDAIHALYLRLRGEAA